MTKIKKILTAMGNPILNDELRKLDELMVIGSDIQYQDGIFEVLELESEINFIILSQLIPGIFLLEELIEKIQNINSKIKIILILEKYDSNLEKILIKHGVYRIFYDNKVEINDIIKIINEDEKMEKYNAEIRKEIDELKKYIKNNYKNEEKNNFRKYLEKNKNNNGCNNNNKFNKEINNRFDNKINKQLYNKKNYIINNELDKNLKNENISADYTKNNFLENKKMNNLFLNKNIIKKIDEKYFIKNIFNIENKNSENKIISVLGNNGSGKSVFSVMLATSLKSYFKKILIIDFDILNNSLHTILGVKKYSEKIKKMIEINNFDKNEIKIENLIININKKIDLISGINLIFDSFNKISEEKIKKIMNKLSEHYDIIIIDTTSECFFEYTRELIKISDKSIFLTEANLLEVSKSKRFLDIYYNNWNIEKNKIDIIFNKFNKNSIDINILKKLYSDYKILGSIKLRKDYNLIINKNLKNIKLNNNLIKKYDTVIRKIC